jgi:hypothetical protein
LVRSHKHIKLCFSLEKQIAVTELGPSHLEGRRDGVSKQISPQSKYTHVSLIIGGYSWRVRAEQLV